MKDEEIWMKKMKEKLSDYSEPVPFSGWEQLEKELMPPVQKKTIPFWKWTAAAAAVLLLVTVTSVCLYFLGTPAADELRQIQVPVLAHGPVLPSDGQTWDEVSAVAQSSLSDASKQNRLAKSVNIKGNGSDKKQLLSDDHSLKPKEVSEQPENAQQLSIETQNSIEKRAHKVSEEKASSKELEVEYKKSFQKPRRPSSRDKWHLPVEGTDKTSSTWSMALSVGNAGGAHTQVSSPSYRSRISMLSAPHTLVEIPCDQTVVFEDGIPYLLQKNQVADVKHHQPLSFGLTFRKALPKGFSVETGLTYTLLSSDVQMDGQERKVDQKLHYLGVPLRANWNFLDKKWLTLYVSGGGAIEKCVYGKLGSEEKTVKPLQFSVSGAVGAQVNASKHVGIYLEPGVAYYFDDHSNVQTIRKENPFQFNVQAGVRFTY